MCYASLVGHFLSDHQYTTLMAYGSMWVIPISSSKTSVPIIIYATDLDRVDDFGNVSMVLFAEHVDDNDIGWLMVAQHWAKMTLAG